jgi:deoxyribonuclease V
MASFVDLHPWNLSPTEAVALQKSMKDRVQIQPLDREIRTVAGTDISFDRGSETVYAGIVVVSLPDLEVVERSVVRSLCRFPYIPGLLSFREIPSLLEAWSRLKTEPDAVMVDGHGYAHPRRIGIASHLGLCVDRPTLGCAKSILVGDFEEPGNAVGDWSPLVHRKEIVGAALRTRVNVKPVFISVGNKIDLEDAIRLAVRCLGSTRIPEPIRLTHLAVNDARRADKPA